MYVTMYVCTFVCMQQNYGTAQQQLDMRTCVNGKKRVGKLNEYMPNPRGCLSRFKSVTVRLLRSLTPTKI